MNENDIFSIVSELTCSSTAQGKIIRNAGRIQYEFSGNGCMNWDNDFEKMLISFLKYVQLGNGFKNQALKDTKILVQLLMSNGKIR